MNRHRRHRRVRKLMRLLDDALFGLAVAALAVAVAWALGL